ncbi:MAG: C10 family peptidase [Paludibacteraceae bacterium]|nr:C10 family peptidase [Paludibacteraceae bacterium]
MRKLFLGFIALVLAVSLYAESRTAEEAASIAAAFVNNQPALRKAHKSAQSAASMRLAFTRQKDASQENAFYVFNRADKAGFIIVSADDRTAEDVLGYSDGGADFDINSINPNLRFWLNRYAEEISVINEDTKVASQPRKAKQVTAIAPLLKNSNGEEITWYQEAPYNNYCPIDQRDNTRSLTGCVATATSAIMYKWQHPAQGHGTRSYTWKDCKNDDCTQSWSITVTSDFDTVTFDWANLLPAYDGKSYTEAQSKAVASLMYNVGVAAKMQYGGDANNGSGAWTDDMGYGLQNYFDYEFDKFITMYAENDYGTAAVSPAEFDVTTAQFISYFNADLEAGRPILMGGEDTSGGGGHEFVCDGRDANNKFHINWGWEGDCNGYFALTALEPTGTSYDFSSNLDALIGLRPAVVLPDANVDWYADGVLFDQTVATAGRLSFPTDTPDDCANGKKFMGWTSVADYASESTAPTFAKEGDLITSDATFYAVYAEEETGSSVASTTTVVMETIGDASGTSGDFTFTGDKGSGTNEPVYNTNNKDARYYAGNTLTISSDKDMTEIVFTLSAQGLRRLTSITASTGTIAAQATGDTEVTWTGNAQSVTFTVGAQAEYGSDGSTKAGQLAFASVDITAGGGTSYYDYATECGSGEPVYYTIRFFDNGTQIGEAQTVQKGKQATVPANPTPACDAYTFVGWWTAPLDADNTEAKSWITNFRATKDQDYYAIYSLTEDGGGTVLTDKYAKITTTGELATGNYVVVGYYNNSKYYAMKNDTKPNYTYYIDTKEVSPSSNVISTTDGSIIWKITVNDNSVSFYNEAAGKYVYLYQNDTHYNVGFTTSTSDNINFTYTVNSGSWDFISTAITTHHLESYGKYSEFAAHTAAGDPIYLYKQQEETSGTTYYSSSVSCIETAVENSEVKDDFMKILRNGQVLIIRDGKTYNVLGIEVR